jgi:NADH-quinone oxidoreductase subunit M
LAFVLRADGLSLAFMALTAATWPSAIFLARAHDRERPAALYALLLLLESAFLGTFAADDALLFALCLESSTIVIYLLISGWGGPQRHAVATRFLCYNLAGSALVLLALFGVLLSAAEMSETSVRWEHPLRFSISAAVRDVSRFASEDVAAREFWNHGRRWILAALVAGLAIKQALAPFHTWFTLSCAEGPLCAAFALIVVGSRVGAYGLARFVDPLCADFDVSWSVLAGLAALASLYLSFLALAHDDMRKMTAYLALSQSAVVAAGVFCLRPAGVAAAVALSIGTGFGSAALLFVVGALERRSGASGMSGFGGIARIHRKLAALMLLSVATLACIPGLSGFGGLFGTLGVLFETNPGSALLVMLVWLIWTWTLFWMLQRVIWDDTRLEGAVSNLGVTFGSLSRMLARALNAQASTAPDGTSIVIETTAASPSRSGDGNDRAAELNDLGPVELLFVAPVIAGILFIGLWPQAVVDLVRASMRAALSRF